MGFPKVIVLILSYNGKELLDDSVFSYLENDYQNFEVVVIDNGSSDGTKKYIKNRYPKAKIIRIEQNKGYSGGFNFGLDYAFNQKHADYVLITNNDVKADKRVISSLVEVAKTDDMIGFVTGKVYYYDNPNILQTVGKKNDPIMWNGGHIGGGEEDNGQYDKIRELYFADDVFTLVSKKLYNEVGGYDLSFFLQAEEYDWQARAKKKGYKIFYTPNAKIWHKESMTIGKISPLKEYYNSRNSLIVILKHKTPDFYRRYFWNHFIYKIIFKSIKVLTKGDAKKAFMIWSGFTSSIFWGIKNNKYTLRHFLPIMKK